MMLVDVASVRRELNLGEDGGCDDELKDLIERSCGIIADYLKRDLLEYTEDSSDPQPVPGQLRSAVLWSVRKAYEGGDPLDETVMRLLHRMRDPAIA